MTTPRDPQAAAEASRALAALERLLLEQREALTALDPSRVERIGAALGDALGHLGPALREGGAAIPRGRIEALKAGLELNAAMVARTAAAMQLRLQSMTGTGGDGYTSQGSAAVAVGTGLRACA